MGGESDGEAEREGGEGGQLWTDRDRSKLGRAHFAQWEHLAERPKGCWEERASLEIVGEGEREGGKLSSSSHGRGKRIGCYSFLVLRAPRYGIPISEVYPKRRPAISVSFWQRWRV
jgi:hypothetical protein